MTAVLAVDALTLRFGGVTALDEVTFSVDAGERVGLVGPNGAGKTSLLNCISGVERPSSGRILMDGRDVTGVPAAARPGLGVARTLQALGLVDDLTVLDNLLLGRHHLMRAGVAGGALRLPWVRREEAAHRQRCREVAEELDLGGHLEERAGGLATGVRKRLELGRTLAQEGRLLLLDEPFAGAAPDDVELMVGAVRSCTSRGAAALIVDHDLATVMDLAHRTVALDAGRLALAS